MGVMTEQDIDYGQIFGPFPEVGSVHQSHFIGLLTTDDREDNTHTIKVNVNKMGPDVTWLPYVIPARTEDEQNIEAYLKEGKIYYRTLRIIRAHEELLVWYSKDFTQILQISTVRRKESEDSDYICDKCGQRIKHMFTMMAHTKFRCPEINKIHPSIFNLHKGERCKEMSMDLSPVQKSLLLEEMRSCKRSSDSMEATVPTKRVCIENGGENNSNSDYSIKDRDSRQPSENWSAFRKVEKSHLREINRNTGSLAASSLSINEQVRSQENEEVKRRLEQSASQSYQHELYAKRFMPVNPFDNRLAGGLGMLLSANLMPSGGGISRNNPYVFSNRVPVSIMDKLPVRTMVPTNGTHLDTSDDNVSEINKRLLMEELRKAQYPYVKTVNPMVGKYMTTSTPAMIQASVQPQSLAQNWCAKCNASFRMTSDLVYHMRSHHKREFDPMKRKREEKLQCNVCHETFKERHHLTRHMTSHT